MTTVERTSADVDAAQSDPKTDTDDTWWTHLGNDGAEGDEALTRLHGLLVRASRHQVWRLRDLLHGADADEIEANPRAASVRLRAVERVRPALRGAAS